MATFEQRFYCESRNPFVRLWRNARLVVYLGQIAWGWFFLGRKLRRHAFQYPATRRKIHVDEMDL